MITSLQNPAVKNVLLLLEKPRARRDQNRIVIEGVREVRHAMAGGFRITDLFIDPGLLPDDGFDLPQNAPETCRLTEVSREVFNRMAYRADSGGVIALAEPRRLAFADLCPGDPPLILVLETVEKPGNLGAILRTADAAGVDAVVICDPQTDIYNPNAIRSGIGTVFTLPVVTASSDETLAWLRASGIRIFAAALTAKSFYHETDFRGPSAIVMGSEAAGLSDTWLHGADLPVKIPMRGRIDSMNVSASAAVIVFEAMRQRGF